VKVETFKKVFAGPAGRGAVERDFSRGQAGKRSSAAAAFLRHCLRFGERGNYARMGLKCANFRADRPWLAMRLPHTLLNWKKRKKMPKKRTMMGSTATPFNSAYLLPICKKKKPHFRVVRRGRIARPSSKVDQSRRRPFGRKPLHQNVAAAAAARPA